MRRHIPGLHSRQENQSSDLEGLFLVQVERASYRWHPLKPFLALQFAILEPASVDPRSFSGRIYCTERALWKLNWFLRDFGYDTELLGLDEIDEKSLVGLRGVVKIRHTVVNGTSMLNLDGFAPVIEWEQPSSASPANLAVWEASK